MATWLPLAAFALGITAVEVARPTASYKAIDLGATALEIGLTGGSFAPLALLAAIPIGRQVDKSGERRLVLMGLGGLIVAVFVEWVAVNVFMLIVGQALLGLGQMALAIATQSLAANSWVPSTSDERFAQLAIAASVGLLAGPAISGLAIGNQSASADRAAGIETAYLISLALAVVGLALGWFVVHSSELGSRRDADKPKADIREILRRPGIVPALVASASVLTTVDLLIAYLPLLGDERSLPPTFIGLLLSIRAASELLARFSLPLFLRRLTRKRILVITFAMATGGIASVSIPLGNWPLIAAMAIVGFSLGLCAPMTAAWIVSSAPVADRGTALAVRMAANRLGQMVVPVALGAVALTLGSFVIFGIAALGLFTSTVVVASYRTD